MPTYLKQILQHYPLSQNAATAVFGTGLINTTWLVTDGSNRYILQKINTAIFTEPQIIADNTTTIANFLQLHNPGYFFVTPVQTLHGTPLLKLSASHQYRLFPFVANSHTINVATQPAQAYEAGKQFGQFTAVLSAMPLQQLQPVIPQFHDLVLRYNQFSSALVSGNPMRVLATQQQVNFLQSHSSIVLTYQQLAGSAQCMQRVTHHDTKISNVLFDPTDKGICVIDLDTVMPGYFFSDVGDMVRTYVSPVSEEENDIRLVKVRDEYYEAIMIGYLRQMKAHLTETELANVTFGGICMVYMQALRFLTDHLNNDAYYGAIYNGQNLVRANNQIALLQLLLQKEPAHKAMIKKAIGR